MLLKAPRGSSVAICAPPRRFISIPKLSRVVKEVFFRNQVLSRYPGFYRSLLNSSSKTVRILARIVSRDPRSNTYKNLKYLERLTKLRHPEFYTAFKIKEALPVKRVPVEEQWRLGLLTT